MNRFRVLIRHESEVDFRFRLGRQNRFRSLPLPAAFAGAAGGRFTLGLRPEALALADQPGRDTIAVELAAITPLNEKSVLFMTMNDGRELLASEAGDREIARRPGPAHLSIDPAAILLFEQGSGRRFIPATSMGT